MGMALRPDANHYPSHSLYLYFQLGNLQFIAHQKNYKKSLTFCKIKHLSLHICKKTIIALTLCAFHAFAMSHREKWVRECFVKLISPERFFRVSPACTHPGSASLLGRIHLCTAPRVGYSTVTFLRSCCRLQAIALTMPKPVNHVILGCYSRSHHSALQFGPCDGSRS